MLFAFYRWRHELRPREGKSLSEGHTNAKWQSQDLNLYILSPEPLGLPFYHTDSIKVDNHPVSYGSHYPHVATQI